jgi:hypothetical protein
VALDVFATPIGIWIERVEQAKRLLTAGKVGWHVPVFVEVGPVRAAYHP